MRFTPITKNDLLFFIPLIFFVSLGIVIDTLIIDTHFVFGMIGVVFVISIFWQAHTDKEALIEYDSKVNK